MVSSFDLTFGDLGTFCANGPSAVGFGSWAEPWGLIGRRDLEGSVDRSLFFQIPNTFRENRGFSTTFLR